MGRSVVVRVLFVALGAAAAALVISWRTSTGPAPFHRDAPRSDYKSGGVFGDSGQPANDLHQSDIERRLARLEARFAEDTAERHRLGEQLAALTAQLAAHPSTDETAAMHAASTPPAGSETPNASAAATNGANASVDDGQTSAMVRALVAAGVDPATVADIKRRHDESTMAEIYLRDQATREQWLNTPRFASELAAIQADRTPLRADIGDDAYDRYLFAMGQANRVRVDDVLSDSPAAQAGLQTGDLIVRYGDDRLFAPGELVDATRSGTAGEAVQVEIIRNGQRMEVEVPRGPLGLVVAATQGQPGAS